MRCIIDTVRATTKPGSTLRLFREQPGRERHLNSERGTARASPRGTQIPPRAGLDLRVRSNQRGRLAAPPRAVTREEYPRHVGWGHSTIHDALTVAQLGDVKQLIAFHHDPGRDDDA